MIINNENDSFIIIKGNRNVMISAPHAVEQTRDGKVKQAEPETGEIARKLSDMGYSAIIKTFNDNDDANYDEISRYKTRLKEYIKENPIYLMLDLHELNPMREMQVCIGTGHGKNIEGKSYLVDLIKEKLMEVGISRITVDNPFAASGENTISSYISRECDIPVVQIELNSGLFMNDEKWIDKMIQAIDNIAMECRETLLS